jgi:hypothetical protein
MNDLAASGGESDPEEIQEKAWTDENELMCWHYDHVSGRNVRGINLLNALYHANGTSIPVAFELVKKPNERPRRKRRGRSFAF